ncbi:MAG: hypothetical protein V4617_17750 [Gemmatimonadota bacterium]
MTDGEQGGKPQVDTPLDPWMAALVRDAMHVEDDAIPREMMWARIRQQRAAGAVAEGGTIAGSPAQVGTAQVGTAQAAHGVPVSVRPLRRMRTAVAGLLAVAATLLVGIGIGRYGVEAGAGVSGTSASAALPAPTSTTTLASLATDPAVVAMEEHLAHSVALLVTVRDEKLDAGLAGDVSGWARELLGTTRLLLDEPQLHEDRTKRLLQDLELVLVQIVQARSTNAPEARRAPSETMRETNLLPRVRAVVTASRNTDESSFRGIAE